MSTDQVPSEQSAAQAVQVPPVPIEDPIPDEAPDPAPTPEPLPSDALPVAPTHLYVKPYGPLDRDTYTTPPKYSPTGKKL
jgi:hypothetical protein